MPALTKNQLDHAKRKVDQALRQKLTVFSEKLGDRPVVPQLSVETMVSLVRTNKATLKVLDGRYVSGGYLPDVLKVLYDFPLPKEAAKLQEQAKKWDAAFQAEEKRLTAIKEKLIDELVMSPDGMAALEKIYAAFA
jgi:hypothetical protein